MSLIPIKIPEVATPKDAEEGYDGRARQSVADVKPQRTTGSSAGAGSGDFHAYRKLRRQEQYRMKKIEEEWRKFEEYKERTERLQTWQAEEEAKTAKRRNKRQRKKAAKQAARKRAKLEKQIGFSADGSFLQEFLEKKTQGASQQQGSTAAPMDESGDAEPKGDQQQAQHVKEEQAEAEAGQAKLEKGAAGEGQE